jgi:ribosome modulation factor
MTDSWTATEVLALSDKVVEGAIARACHEPARACPYDEISGRARAWLYGWLRANALLADGPADELEWLEAAA